MDIRKVIFFSKSLLIIFKWRVNNVVDDDEDYYKTRTNIRSQSLVCLELTYNTPVYITGVDTFETLDVKSVTSMEACKSDGTWVPLWKLCGEPKVYPTYGDVKDKMYRSSRLCHWHIDSNICITHGRARSNRITNVRNTISTHTIFN